MKLLLVFLNNEYRTFVPPNLSSLGGYVRRAGHEVRVFDTSFFPDVVNIGNIERNIKAGTYKGVDYSSIGVKHKEGDSEDAIIDIISDYKPDLIGFGVYGYTIDIAKKISKAVKKAYSDIPIIYGGIEVTLHPEKYINKSYVDMICVGEGEQALLEICNRIERSDRNFSGIDNIWIKENGEVKKALFGQFMNMDDLVGYDWEPYESYQHYSPFNGKLKKMAMVEFSRGCPYSCTYCESTTLKNLHADAGIKKYTRHKSPEKFVEECESLVKKYGVEMFYFCDGTFLIMPDKVLRILVPLFKEKVNRPFFCLTTVPSITEERAQLLKDMGCVQVNMGVEAGDQKYREDVLGRPNMTNERIVDAFRIMRSAGITTSSYNMIGMPWQNRKDVFETIELNRMAKPDFINVSIFIPFDGTILLKRLIEEGYVAEQLVLGDETQCTVSVPTDMSIEEIESIQRLFVLYCKVPKELFPLLELCEKDEKIFSKVMDVLKEIYLH